MDRLYCENNLSFSRKWRLTIYIFRVFSWTNNCAPCVYEAFKNSRFLHYLSTCSWHDIYMLSERNRLQQRRKNPGHFSHSPYREIETFFQLRGCPITRNLCPRKRTTFRSCELLFRKDRVKIWVSKKCYDDNRQLSFKPWTKRVIYFFFCYKRCKENTRQVLLEKRYESFTITEDSAKTKNEKIYIRRYYLYNWS